MLSCVANPLISSLTCQMAQASLWPSPKHFATCSAIRASYLLRSGWSYYFYLFYMRNTTLQTMYTTSNYTARTVKEQGEGAMDVPLGSRRQLALASV